MSIVIISSKIDELRQFENKGFNILCCDVSKININELDKPIYYVSPANALLFMDGGIDKVYMNMFNGIEGLVKKNLKKEGPISKLGRPYLPIGCSMITKVSDDKFLIGTPTMLMPQPVKDTNNAYYATKAILKLWPKKGTLLMVPLCCGYGHMSISTCS